MIDIQSLASGSTGNCYKIDDGSSSLLIEAGIPINQIKTKLNYRLSEIEGVLISHEHGDHSKAVMDVMKSGIDIYMSPGTAKALKIKNHRIHKVMSQFKVRSWYINPFLLEHDTEQPCGFLLQSIEGDKLVYITDTMYSKYNFNNLNYIMIETNYSIDILKENVKKGVIHPAQKNRVIKSHMGLETAKDFLRANDLSKVKEIWLLHLSNDNSDEKRFKKEVQALAGKPTFIA